MPFADFWGEVPLRPIDVNHPADVRCHQRMVAAGSPQENELLQRLIAFTAREVDALVYELYGITAEEIRIVEGK